MFAPSVLVVPPAVERFARQLRLAYDCSMGGTPRNRRERRRRAALERRVLLRRRRRR